MPIYDLIIYDRYGQCLIHRPFNQADVLQVTSSARVKMLYKLLYTMQYFSDQLSPVNHANPNKEPLKSFSTPTYRLFHHISPTGLRFVIVSDTSMKLRAGTFQSIYNVFVTYVLSSPFYTQGAIPSVIPPTFEKQLQQILTDAVE